MYHAQASPVFCPTIQTSRVGLSTSALDSSSVIEIPGKKGSVRRLKLTSRSGDTNVFVGSET